MSPTSTRADELALVLTAAGIPSRVEPVNTAWAVLVPGDDAARAEAVLTAYDEETRPAPPAAPPAPEYPWMTGVVAGLLFLGIFAVTGPPAAGSRWFAAGAASAAGIRSGELWRTVTALTLHVDAFHVAGNAVATAVLLPPVVERLGVGVALCLMLVSGAGGNWLGAVVHDPRHVSVGASTATFGVLGILAGLRLFPAAEAGRRRWVIVAAGLVLLALLGASPGADVVAHALGLGVGGVLGLGAGVALRRRPRLAVQWPLAALAAFTVAACWWVALGGVSGR